MRKILAVLIVAAAGLSGCAVVAEPVPVYGSVVVSPSYGYGHRHHHHHHHRHYHRGHRHH